MQNILEMLESLLRKYDLLREANTVSSTLDLLKLNRNEAYQQMSSEKWWIGEDAVAETDLSIAGGFMPEARHDQQQFQQLIINLYEQLQKAGYENDFARLITSQYQKWQISGM